MGWVVRGRPIGMPGCYINENEYAMNEVQYVEIEYYKERHGDIDHVQHTGTNMHCLDYSCAFLNKFNNIVYNCSPGYNKWNYR